MKYRGFLYMTFSLIAADFVGEILKHRIYSHFQLSQIKPGWDMLIGLGILMTLYLIFEGIFFLIDKEGVKQTFDFVKEQ